MPDTAPLSDKRSTPQEARFVLGSDRLELRATGRREYRARLIRAGRIRAQGGAESHLEIPVETLRDALDRGLFNGKPSFVDHPGWLDYPSLRNLAGVTASTATWDPIDQAVENTIRLYDTDAGNIIGDLFDAILADVDDGEPAPDIGLSAVLWARWEKIEQEDGGPSEGVPKEPTWSMARIRHVESIDFVFEPGADGRVKEALTALNSLPGPRAEALAVHLGLPAAAGLATASPKSLVSNPQSERSPTMSEEVPTITQEVSHVPEEVSPATAADWLQSLRQSSAEAIIAAATDLPTAARARLRRMSFSTPEEVQTAIAEEREYLASLVEDDVVQVGSIPPRGAHITLGRTGLEQLGAALESLIAGVHPPAGVAPLTGIREAYHLLSGDYEMHGLFQPERISLANVTSSTMAGLVANAMNKVLVNMFATYPQWWAPAVTVMDFTTLQDVRWITLGGVGELPTVAEGAAYTELTWDDQTETDSFVKKGGYLGITLEAIDKDDTGRLRAAPRALAQSAWLTLGKSIANIFTSASGLGPTMSDTGTLFNATAVSTTGGHANLLATALSYSQWEVVKIAMMKQAELHSSERLGALTRPKLLWVPVDLETTAIQILASEGEPGGAAAVNDINVNAVGEGREERLRRARDRVIVCPFFTETDHWAAQADPLLYPSIGLGFRYGRTPEIFSVASPTAGLMFTNDVMPVKVRFFFAVGPTDWRGLHKSNV
jgi:hypothetical protein